jgi:excinuclease ABC subunit C
VAGARPPHRRRRPRAAGGGLEGAGDGALADRVFLPGRKNPIPLRAETTPLQVLALARDEAHRLANRFHRKARRKRVLASVLDDIRGVGPKTKRALLLRLGSVKRIREADVKEIAAVEGVGRKLAEAIKAALGS